MMNCVAMVFITTLQQGRNILHERFPVKCIFSTNTVNNERLWAEVVNSNLNIFILCILLITFCSVGFSVFTEEDGCLLSCSAV